MEIAFSLKVYFDTHRLYSPRSLRVKFMICENEIPLLRVQLPSSKRIQRGSRPRNISVRPPHRGDRCLSDIDKEPFKVYPPGLGPTGSSRNQAEGCEAHRRSGGGTSHASPLPALCSQAACKYPQLMGGLLLRAVAFDSW